MYLLQAVGVEEALTLTQDRGAHLVARHNCADSLGRDRVAGEEWLVTAADTESLPPQIGIVRTHTLLYLVGGAG